jgi:hypothetical protein
MGVLLEQLPIKENLVVLPTKLGQEMRLELQEVEVVVLVKLGMEAVLCPHQL